MFLPLMRDRIMSALAGTPDVLDALLGSVSPHDPCWDIRPDPARFTLREIVAHLADYEAIWYERLTRTRDEEFPVLHPVDPDVLASEDDYAQSNPATRLAWFRDCRFVIVDCLRKLSQEDWLRAGQLGDRGPLTLEEQAAFVVIHDGYHTGQVAQWLSASRR